MIRFSGSGYLHFNWGNFKRLSNRKGMKLKYSKTISRAVIIKITNVYGTLTCVTHVLSTLSVLTIVKAILGEQVLLLSPLF